MNNRTRTLAGVIAGAGLMYLLDPDRGARRRALVRDRATRARHRFAEGAEATSRDLRNRARGAVAELRSRLRHESAGDQILYERVRSALGRAVTHPGAIEVAVADGRVTLQGQVLADELDDLLRSVRKARGVSEVRNELTVRSSPEGVPALQGGRRYDDRAQDHWSPATRMAVGMISGLLAARALTNRPTRRFTASVTERWALDVQKTVHVNAPVEQVWALWSDFESWPRFMSHLKEVRRTGPDRSHWVAKGPAGAGVEWDAVTTEWLPNEAVAWRSVEGSTVECSGRVRFRPDPRGGTVIEIRMSYHPPAGALGHAVASLLGVDPETAIDEDMVRLKSLLEEGKASADQGQVRLDELPAGQAPPAS